MTVVTTNEIGTIKIEIVKNCYNELRKKRRRRKVKFGKIKIGTIKIGKGEKLLWPIEDTREEKEKSILEE